MKKKNKKLVLAGIIIIAIIGVLYLTPLLEIIGLTSPDFCSETPYDEDCVCLDGFNRIINES